MKRKIILLFIFLFSITINVIAQNTGVIKGQIDKEASASQVVNKVIIKEYVTNSIIQEIPVEKGLNFTAFDIPFGSYIIEVLHNNEVLSKKFVTVSSPVPVEIEINPEPEYSLDEVEVFADYNRYKTGGRTIYTAETISSLPSISAGTLIENIITSSPGVVPDEDGRLHVRGEDAQLQYVIDGIPITNNQTRIYTTLMNAGIIKSLDFQRGGINPEYGVATAGVLSINTKSGFDKPFFAHAYGDIGSYNMNDFGLEAGGNIGQRAGLFLAYSGLNTDRYLDPVSFSDSVDIGEPYHDYAHSNNFFGKFDALVTDDIDLVTLFSYGKTTFQVPNSFPSSAQDQVHENTNYTAGFRLLAGLSSKSLLSILGYARSDKVTARSNGLLYINNFQDSILALNNEKYFIGNDREIKNIGGNIEFNTSIFSDDNFRAGVGGELFPIDEFFTFAITNPDLSNPDISGGDVRFRSYDITQGGTPFLVDTSYTGSRYFAYAQEVFDYNKWHFIIGVRYDHINLLENEDNISAKVGTSYTLSDDLVLRASYNRLVMMAPIENILVSSSSQAYALVTAEQQFGVPQNVKSEKSHVLELGSSYLYNRFLTVDLDVYGKLIDDFIVKVELGNSGIIFPANLRKGFVAGGELQFRLNNWNNFSGFLNFSTTASFGIIPEDSSISPVSGGLILGEEGQNYKHPFAGEDFFPTEHNQIFTAVMNLTYNNPTGYFITFGSRFDSGLPFDLAGENGKGLSAEESRIELRKRGYPDEVIDLLSLEPEADNPDSPDKSVASHFIIDLAAGIDLREISSIPVRLTGTIANVFDTMYLYKFESTFGGTHFGLPRTFSLRAEVFFDKF